MNQTIEKLVGLLFEDIEETEEVRAIHEEVLTNCQERYEDLLASGLTADEATQAVIESLKGMEEMLKPYPRKMEEPVQEDAVNLSFEAAKEIHLKQMHNADIVVEQSENERIHVLCSDAECKLSAQMEDGVLQITRSDRKTNVKAHVELDWNSLGGWIDTLVQRLVKTASRLAGITITLQIPKSLRPALHIGAASGDLRMNGVELRSLVVGMASGDIEIENTEVAETAKLSSASGDINWWAGSCCTLDIGSASGDVEVDGAVDELSIKTTSGDVRALLRGERLHIAGIQATSGDIDLVLPHGIEAEIRCHTISGDVHQRCANVEGSPVKIKASTVSGDIVIK